jgi:hypothetical protein
MFGVKEGAVMRAIKPMVLVALLLCCGDGIDVEPVCQEASDWQVQGETIPRGVATAVALARAASPCPVATFGGTVTFQVLPFIYEGKMVEGWVEQVECNPRMGVTTWAEPVESTALTHELGHVLWERCGQSSFDRERNCHPRSFLRWVWDVTRTVASALGDEPPGPFVLPSWACPEDP